jgi:PAS domain S-box-containing protein
LTFLLISRPESNAAAIAFDPALLLVGALLLVLGALGVCLYHYGRRTAELRAAETRYREVVDPAIVGIFVLSAEGGFVRANPALARIFGFTKPEELLGLSAEQVRQLFVTPKRLDFLALFRTNENVVKFESEIRRSDGTSAWIEETARAIRGADGNLFQVRGFVIDITERKHAAAALAASEERYRVLFDHLPIGIVEYDYRPTALWFEQLRVAGVSDLADWLRANPEALRMACGRVAIVGANPATLRLLGAKNYEEGVANLDRIYNSDVFEARRKTFLALWAGETQADGEFSVNAVDGRLLRLIYRWRVPVIDGRPHFERTQLVLVDVTEMKSAEQALAAERERLSVTLRAMSESVVTIDESGVVQFMNDAAAELTGWPAAAAMGHPLREVCVLGSDKGGQPIAAPVAAALSTDRPVDLPPYTLVRPREGPPRCVEGRCVPVHDLKRRVIGAVVVLRDVTQRSRLEADLLRASKMESIGVLAGGIAHDFNNLLSIVMGNLSLALLDEQAKSAAEKWLREAERATLRAKDLTQQLLTFAKGGEPVRAAVPLADIVREAAQFALHGSSVRCEFDLAKDLRPADADKGQIAQVVQNLVINAVQAMPNGGEIHLSLANETLAAGEVATLPAGNYVRLELADSGRGIAPDHLARIFEPFFTTKEYGTGLGLATVYSVIQKHRGYITVESVVERGTTFRFWLPAARVEPPAPAVTVSPFDPIKGRILFMDDEEPIRMMTRALLERLGLQVKVTGDGNDAIREFAAARTLGQPFDVVIFDLTVPGGMGGADAMREILKIDPAAKGIVSSGYSSDPVMANFRAHGFRGSVPKPYRMADIAQMIREVLNGN